jgi:DNA methylase
MWTILTSGMISAVVHMKAGVPRPDRPGGFDDDVTYPAALVCLFVEEFTQPGDLVCDPFAGFGTRLVVAEQVGRNVLGLEILPERCQATPPRAVAARKAYQAGAPHGLLGASARNLC